MTGKNIRGRALGLLKKKFAHYNTWYFGGQLKVQTLQFKRMPKLYGLTEHNDDGTVTISISSELINLWDCVWITLLHEMCHVKNGPDYKEDHGWQHKIEMDRLYRAGAYEDLL